VPNLRDGAGPIHPVPGGAPAAPGRAS
jgi:hypothetical protein